MKGLKDLCVGGCRYGEDGVRWVWVGICVLKAHMRVNEDQTDEETIEGGVQRASGEGRDGNWKDGYGDRAVVRCTLAQRPLSSSLVIAAALTGQNSNANCHDSGSPQAS